MNVRHRTHDSFRWRDIAVQFLLVLGAALFYFFIRGLTQGSIENAESNARSILRVENFLGIEVETATQDLVGPTGIWVTLSNWVYIWGHWPVLIITLYSLYRWHPADYRWLRNAMFVSGAIGMIIYATFPVSPPRLLDPVYRDTVTDLSNSYRILQPPALVNKYAAMPSLHAGWNLLAGIAIARVARRWPLRLAGLLGPAAMAFAVVATGNHYVLDVIAGEMVALVGLWYAQRTWPTRITESSSVGRKAASDLIDQFEIVDDQMSDTEPDQLDRSIDVVDAPRSEPWRQRRQTGCDRRRDQPLIDHDPVRRRPPTYE